MLLQVVFKPICMAILVETGWEHSMKILVLGGTGATGRLLVQQLLQQDHDVLALVRHKHRFEQALEKAAALPPQARIEIIEQTALSIDRDELTALLASCDGVASCLGHNLTWRGIYGAPQMLVRDSIQRICESIDSRRQTPLHLVLMNTTGNRNLDQSEPVSFAQHCVLWLLRILLPPHVDNERAANYLRTKQKHNELLKWVAVRPDGLTDEKDVSEYNLHPAPIRSAIFDAGKTSRMNVANFMARLLIDNNEWQKWQGKMPVIYNV